MSTPAPSQTSALLDSVTARLAGAALAPDVETLILDALREIQDVGAAAHRGVYLKSVTAQGFRGIGAAATLRLPAGAGLTVVQGRNGSGKSSFAEAVEVAVTGRNRRWEDENGGNVQPTQREGWRNLHHDGPRRVEVELLLSGRPEPITLARIWPGDDFTDSTATLAGLGPAPVPLTALRWSEALRTYRPFLSYSELGQMMTAKPSQMYDRLSSLLGLGAISDAEKRLAMREKELADHDKRAKAALPHLLTTLEGVDDERARKAKLALCQHTPDGEQVRALVTGTETANPEELSQLRRLADLHGPDPEAVAAAVLRLRHAVATAEDHRHSDAGAALARADLLDRALRVRAQHPQDQTCPVCKSPMVLDEGWAVGAVEQMELLREEAAEATSAQRELGEAANSLRAMVLNAPVGLHDSLAPLWDEWTACRSEQDLDVLAVSAEKRAFALAEACRQIREDAARQLAEQDEQWHAVLPALAAWLSSTDAAVAAKPVIAQIKKARAWLKKTQAELRDERVADIADKAQAIWAYLSQESNVSLGQIALTGSDAYTGRGVALNVTVDDVDAAALGVVSQGELFSLALALFLPRAMAQQSPFNFIVIDDPVQSMDPRKVEGLARLLHLIAQTHQVVVFTHDTRLPDALRFHRIPATVLEVGRYERSQVGVRTAADPVKRELAAAKAVAKDQRITPEILREVLPGQCRAALEAGLREAARRTLFAAALDHLTVERRLDQAKELIPLASLALFGEKRDKSEVYQEIEHRFGLDARILTEQCNRGAHSTIAHSADAQGFIERAARLAEGFRNL